MTEQNAMATPHGLVMGPSLLDSTSLDFQLVIKHDETTLSAGSIVPFGDGDAKIEEMKITTGLKVNPRCTTR